MEEVEADVMDRTEARLKGFMVLWFITAMLVNGVLSVVAANVVRDQVMEGQQEILDRIDEWAVEIAPQECEHDAVFELSKTGRKVR